MLNGPLAAPLGTLIGFVLVGALWAIVRALSGPVRTSADMTRVMTCFALVYGSAFAVMVLFVVTIR